MKKIKGNTYIYESAVCQGAYHIDEHWVIIDSGSNESNAKKSVKDLQNQSIDYIINTHFHADHCGGNNFFQKKHNAKIIAPDIEASFIKSPILEPVYLYGAYPPKELQNRFLMAKESIVDIEHTGQSIELNLGGQPVLLETVSFPGHSPNMIGVITPDNIAFVGDAVIDGKIVEKHPLIFSYNIKEHLNTLEKVKALECDGFVLAHGGYFDSIDGLIEINRNAILGISHKIKEIIASSTRTIEDVHQILSRELNLSENLTTYTLNHSVIKAHIQYLIDSDLVEPVIDDGRLIFRNKLVE